MRVTMLATLLQLLCGTAMTATTECKAVLSVAEVLRQATKLDGKVVCVRGILKQARFTDHDHLRVTAPEMISLEDKRKQANDRDAVTILDWSAETGFDAGLYKPDSFAEIQTVTSEGTGASEVTLNDTTLRVGVMYKRRFLERAQDLSRKTIRVAIQGPHRDVEVVLLEIVKVNVGSGRTTRTR